MGAYVPAAFAWQHVLLVAACGAAILPFAGRVGCTALCVSVGLWLAMIPGITEANQFLPLPDSTIATVEGIATSDSRQAASGNRWFTLAIERAYDGRGSGGTARATIHVLYDFPAEAAAGERLRIDGRLTSSGWLRADSIGRLGWISAAARVRSRILASVQRELEILAPITGGLAEALLIGRTDSLSADMHLLFQDNGLLHVLALSGMHLGILIGVPLLVLRRMVGIQLALVVALLLTAVFIWIVGARSSLMRAGLFLAISGCWLMRGSPLRPLVILSQAFILLSLVFPSLLSDIGFQLSFSAVAGILIFSPPILACCSARMPSFLKPVYAPVAAGIGASVGGLPIAAAAWGVWFPLGILLTVAIVPAVTLLMYLSIILAIGYAAMLPPLLLAPLSTAASAVVSGITLGLEYSAGRFRVPLHGATGTAIWVTIILVCAALSVHAYRFRCRLCEESCITPM